MKICLSLVNKIKAVVLYTFGILLQSDDCQLKKSELVAVFKI